MDRWVEREVSVANRLSAQLMLMSCGLFLGLAVVLRMDMLMCMFIVLALRTFYQMLKGQGSKNWNQFLFPFYIFMAVFSKGPVGILVPLVSTFIFLLITGRVKTNQMKRSLYYCSDVSFGSVVFVGKRED